MIKQSYIDGNSILIKKFKILRMSILLGNSKNREETLKEYEETAKEVDKYLKGVYEEILSSKMYTTITLEEEQKRLIDLIAYIEKRIDERNKFIDDYLKITNNFLDDIDRVSLEDNLPTYKLRLNDIEEYLANVKEIEKINKLLIDRRNELEEKYENKANNEVINGKLEEELIDEFNKIIVDDEYYKKLNYLDINNELDNINKSINEKKEVMNTFISSYEALKNAGISGAEREEYLSYVQDSKKDYYNCLEKKYILSIYKEVLDKENDYDKLYQKRENLENILITREKNRKELEINERDILGYFRNVCEEQFSIIKSQKINMENIDKLILDITNYEDRLEELEKNNNRKEILDLLEEFKVNKPVIKKIELPEEQEIFKEVKNQKNNIDTKPSNMIIRIDEPTKMNTKIASDNAKLVMKKVVLVLEPKKYSIKNNKLKESELSKEKSNETNSQDLIEIDLDRHDIFTDDDADEINISTRKDELTIPTEIVIEEPKDETIDLFKETDPFLDDNNLEINSKNQDIEKNSKIPKISNIGTVKPNNIIDKIENATKENEDIIIPTMGIVDNNQNDVPIVSENYIN